MQLLFYLHSSHSCFRDEMSSKSNVNFMARKGKSRHQCFVCVTLSVCIIPPPPSPPTVLIASSFSLSFLHHHSHPSPGPLSVEPKSVCLLKQFACASLAFKMFLMRDISLRLFSFPSSVLADLYGLLLSAYF